jgi:hypothetical protein
VSAPKTTSVRGMDKSLPNASEFNNTELNTTELNNTELFVAYWAGEGGGQPLRVGTDRVLAVWDSLDAVKLYQPFARAVLQPVSISSGHLAALEGQYVLNPVA